MSTLILAITLLFSAWVSEKIAEETGMTRQRQLPVRARRPERPEQRRR